MTLSNYNSNENADFNSGEMILSNYDFNETANYEPSESEDIYILIPDITSMICDHIITKFYYRKYMLKKKNRVRYIVHSCQANFDGGSVELQPELLFRKYCEILGD